ncbi:MAG: DUF3168 domain-containing protein [Alphaproteobacteria bacterium]|nr:MAG: DUF3168 domain-containing protein [Alphaproteobacteria bacterium]
MSGFASWELQQAVFAALNGDTALAARVTGVFDQVPSGTAFPYVAIGDSESEDWSSVTFTGQEHRFAIEVWSRDGGHMEVKEIMALVHDVLHDAPLVLTGHQLVNLRLLSAEDVLEMDGLTYHGTLTFRAVTQAL